MKKSKIIINILGYILIVLSLIFIIYTLRKIDLRFLFTGAELPFLLSLIPLAVLYSGIFVVLAINFSVLMSSINKEKKINPDIIPNYLKSNIGKYLPTNLFHFAGRHMLINNLGYENKKILMGNIMEFIMLIFISLILLLAGLISTLIRIPPGVIKIMYRNRILFSIIAFVFLAGGIILLIKFTLKKIISFINSLLSGFKIKTLFLLLFSYSLFFIFTGTILYIILCHFSGRPFVLKDFFYTIFAFSICWQIGFISPGVPGGIGIREALLLMFFSGPYGDSIAFSSSIVLRLITISGDVIAFLYALLINKLIKKRRELK
ncbi:MAG: hypothetical protein JXJ04_22660 [Spirochaetales bacterium]|nr:hypothetical protein [Spirochaetales bacterium]